MSMSGRQVATCEIGILSNDDGDGNENGKKAIGSDFQNNNSARASRFFVHFFAVTARPRGEQSINQSTTLFKCLVFQLAVRPTNRGHYLNNLLIRNIYT